MKFKKSISRLILLITIFSLVASIYGIFSSQGKGQYDFKSIHLQLLQFTEKGYIKMIQFQQRHKQLHRILLHYF